MKQVMDFHKAAIAHLLWKRKLRAFLDNRETLSGSSINSRRSCELGKWLYGHGLNDFKDMPEIVELEKIHAEFHLIVSTVIRLKKEGHLDEAEEEYLKLTPLSKDIIALLSELGVRLEQN